MMINNDNVHHSCTREVRLFLTLALPTVLSNLCRTAMGLTDVSILGHYHPSPAPFLPNTTTTIASTQYLAAAGYTVTWLSMASAIVVQGLAAAVSVLGANAFGATNIRLLGYYLQISLSMSTLGGIVVSVSTWYAGSIMQILIGFDNSMYDLVKNFARIMLIGYLPFVWTTCLNAWLISQKQTLPQLITYLTCVGINIGLNLLFIYGYSYGSYGWNGIGFLGSALATSVSRWLQFIVMAIIVYRQVQRNNRRIKFTGCDEKTRSNSQQWDAGFIPLPSELDLQDENLQFDWSFSRSHTRARLKRYMAQAFPMALTGLLEDGQIQLIGILAGRLGIVAAATHNGIFQVFWFLSSFMWAISAATKVRISIYLGSGDSKGALFSMKIATVIALPMAAVVAAILIVGRDDVGKIFSHDPQVLALVSQISYLVGIGYFFLSIFYISVATLVAQGRPMLIAFSFVVGAWLTSVPLAFFFRTWKIDLPFDINIQGLFGLWASMSIGYFVTSMLGLLFVCHTNWEKVTAEALERAEIVKQQPFDFQDFQDGSDLNSEGGAGINSRASTPVFDSNSRRGYGGNKWREEEDLSRRRNANRHDSLLQPLI